MLFHEALHLVFTTFSRQVLQQGRLTNYLADCGVFDTFDDRRTICLTIDNRYGARIYTCLSHSPYKEQFDAIVSEVKLLHPTIDPLQVDYVFQSIRFAWGKIKSVRPPKPPVLFAPPRKKRSSPIARKASNRASARPIAKRPIAKRPSSPPFRAGAGGRPTSPKKRTTPAFKPYTLHPTQKQQIHWKLLFKSIGFAILQILLYVVLVQCLIGGFVFLIEGQWYGLIGILIGVIILYVLYRKHNP